MKYFPMFLDMTGRRIVLAGGGEQIAQKCRLLKRTTAALTIMSEELIPELRRLVESGRAAHVPVDVDEAAFVSADYAFIATEDDDLDLEVAELARAAGALVNMVDKPDQCDMIFPAIVDRDPVVAAIGTEGAAPAVAKTVKTLLEGAMSPKLGAFVRMLAARRGAIAEKVPEAERLPFWRWATEDEPWRLWLKDDESAATAMIDAAIDAGGPPTAAGGGVTMATAPEAPDLATMRLVNRLQQAGAVFHAIDADQGLLEYARRDAERFALDRCPRHDGLDAIRKQAAEGAVVVLCDAACAAAETLGDVERL